MFGRLDSQFVLLVEDDNLPGFGDHRRLLEGLKSQTGDVAAIMGAYRSRPHWNSICASRGGQYLPWTDRGQKALLEADWIGGGFTLYRTDLISPCFPLEPELQGTGIQGWDVVLCLMLRARRLKLLVDGSLHVAHLCPEVLQKCPEYQLLQLMTGPSRCEAETT